MSTLVIALIWSLAFLAVIMLVRRIRRNKRRRPVCITEWQARQNAAPLTNAFIARHTRTDYPPPEP
jgi:hypothetical protein